MPKLDLSKPVQTRDGKKVRILCTDLKGANGESIIALISDNSGEYAKSFHDDGSYIKWAVNDCDLINVPQLPTYRPWTAEEVATHVGEKVKSKDASVLSGIISRVEKAGGIWIGGPYAWNALEVFNLFIFLDGTPCGQKVD